MDDFSKEKDLILSIKISDVENIEDLIKSGVDVNKFNENDKISPLMLAAYYNMNSDYDPFEGHSNFRLNPNGEKIIELLINAGADIDYSSEKGDVLLFWRGPTENSKMFKFIVNNKKELNNIAPDKSNYLTCGLIRWIALEDYKLLHNKGVDINLLNNYNHNSFFNAAAFNRFDIMAYLLDNNIDMSVICNKTNKNIIEYLISENNHEALNLISKYPFYKSLSESLVNKTEGNKRNKI